MADLLQDKKFSDFSEISSTQDKTIYFVGYEENGNNIKISDTNLLSGLERIEEVDDIIKFHINDDSIHKTDDDVNNLISISNQVKTINADTTNLNENEVKNSDYFIIYSTSNLYLDTLVENVQEDCFVYCDVINKSDSTISIYNSSISTSKSIYNLKTNEILSAKISKIIDEENQTTLYKINVLEKEDVTMVNLLSSTTPKNEYRDGNVYYSYKNSNKTLAIEYDVSNMSSSSFFRWQVGNANFTDSSFYEISNNRIVNAIYSGGTATTRAILSGNSFDITAPSVTINGKNIIEPINSISTIQSNLTTHVNNGEIHKNTDQIKEIINESKQIKSLDVSSTNINTNDVENGDSFIIRTTSNLYLDTLLSNVQEDCFVYCDVINKSDSTISIYNSSISTENSIYKVKTNQVFSAKISKIIDGENILYKINVLEKEDTLMTDMLSSSVPKNELKHGNVYYAYKNINSSQSIEYDVANMASGSFFRWQVGDTNFVNSSFFEVSNNRIVQAIYSGGVSNTKFILSNNVLDITAQQVNINGNNIIDPINSISTIQSKLTSHVENSDIHKNEEQIKEIINETNQIKTIDASTTNINETEVHNGDSFIIRTTSNLYLDTLLTNVQKDCFVYCDVINKTNSPISIYNSSISTSEPIYTLEQNSVFSTKVSKIIDESIYKIDILEKGKSAYEIWLDAGNSGTESDFLTSLKGDKGDKGESGENGKNAYQYASEAGYGGTEKDFSKALLDSSIIVANYDYDKMMNWARAVCFSKTPYPEEFLIAEEATTEAEWRSLAPNSFAINGEDQEVYVEYHPKSEGGKIPWQMSPVAQRYYLVTKKSYAANAGWMCRGVYNFIWNLDSSVGALHLNALDLDLIKFWFVYIPNATYCDTLYNCIFGKNASVVIVAPNFTGANAGIILDTQDKISGVSTKHYIRCYLPSLNTSCSVAPYHRAIASGIIFTLGSLPDVTSNTTKPTIRMGIDPDLVASTAEDGTMTFTDENLQTAVDNATAKGWTVAFNVTPYPETTTTTGTETSETDTSADPSIIDAPSAYSVLSDSTSLSTTELWYHCELNEYGNYLNSDGARVSITSAKGFFGGADDGSWFKATSENEAANNWNLTYSPLSLQ